MRETVLYKPLLHTIINQTHETSKGQATQDNTLQEILNKPTNLPGQCGLGPNLHTKKKIHLTQWTIIIT